MDIRFNCPRCGQNLTVEERGAGMLVNCPNCQKQIEIPRPTAPLNISPPSGPEKPEPPPPLPSQPPPVPSQFIPSTPLPTQPALRREGSTNKKQRDLPDLYGDAMPSSSMLQVEIDFRWEWIAGY